MLKIKKEKEILFFSFISIKKTDIELEIERIKKEINNRTGVPKNLIIQGGRAQ